MKIKNYLHQKITFAGPVFGNFPLLPYTLGNALLNGLISIGFFDGIMQQPLSILAIIMDKLEIREEKRQEKKEAFLRNNCWVSWRMAHFRKPNFCQKQHQRNNEHEVTDCLKTKQSVLLLYCHTQLINSIWHTSLLKKHPFVGIGNLHSEEFYSKNQQGELYEKVKKQANAKSILLANQLKMAIKALQNTGNIVFIALDGNESNNNEGIASGWLKLQNPQTKVFTTVGFIDKAGKYQSHYTALNEKTLEEAKKNYLNTIQGNFQYFNTFGLQQIHQFL